jgi:peptide-methionine (S)-S-oxide reductase
MEIATLGGGCFWCMEAIFLDLQGVHSVVSGFMGGTTSQPTYQEVCTGSTGHAEVAQIAFDPDVLPYSRLLEVFFGVHNPTTLNRQGEDVGTQYRSVIFCHTPEQRATALECIRRLSEAALFDDPIVTEVADALPFWPAEEYHRNYLALHPAQPYCAAVVAPKLAHFRSQFAALRKPAPGRSSN